MYVPQSIRNFSDTDDEPGLAFLQCFIYCSSSKYNWFKKLFLNKKLTLRPAPERRHLAALHANWAATTVAPGPVYRAAAESQTIAVWATPTFAAVPCDRCACRTECERADAFGHCERPTMAGRVLDTPKCNSRCLVRRSLWKTMDWRTHQSGNSWCSSSGWPRAHRPGHRWRKAVRICAERKWVKIHIWKFFFENEPPCIIVDGILDDVQMNLTGFFVLRSQVVDQMIHCVPRKYFKHL